MNQQKPFFKVTFAKDWIIRRPYVYRYLNRKYVDQFFKDGTLRLSSFQQFAKHTDEQRNDPSEGRGMVQSRSISEQGLSASAYMSQGHDAYVLCGSTFYDTELAKAFGCDSGFRINDTTAFANAISTSISGFRAGIEGSCLYVARRVVDRTVDSIKMDDFTTTSDPDSIDSRKMMDFFATSAGDDLFFMKPNTYANQNEYRLLWFVNGDAELFIDIKCPEALQFCVRFEDLQAEG